MIEPTFWRGFERAVRVLEDHLDAAPQRDQLPAAELGDIDPVIEDLAGGRLFEPQDAAAHRCLAAAAFADQPQGLAAADREIDAVDRLHVADMTARDHPFVDREMHLEAAHLQQRRRPTGRRGHAASPDAVPRPLLR